MPYSKQRIGATNPYKYHRRQDRQQITYILLNELIKWLITHRQSAYWRYINGIQPTQ
jgi:hypothetical protein